MQHKQLQQQIDDMKAKLAEIEALLNQPVINYWQPEEGEFYFFLDNFNTIDKIRRASDGLNETRYRVFKTEKEAEKYANNVLYMLDNNKRGYYLLGYLEFAKGNMEKSLDYMESAMHNGLPKND